MDTHDFSHSGHDFVSIVIFVPFSEMLMPKLPEYLSVFSEFEVYRIIPQVLRDSVICVGDDVVMSREASRNPLEIKG